MNIFMLDENPEKCVQQYHDRHVVKMTLETAQMLCAVHYFFDDYDDIPYRKAYYNHTCCRWIRESLANYLWVCELGMAMSKEYTYRFGKIHKSQAVIEWAIDHIPDYPDNLDNDNMTPFVRCMPDQYKSDVANGHTQNVIDSYRTYYWAEKLFTRKGDKNRWTDRNPPRWLDYYYNKEYNILSGGINLGPMVSDAIFSMRLEQHTKWDIEEYQSTIGKDMEELELEYKQEIEAMDHFYETIMETFKK